MTRLESIAEVNHLVTPQQLQRTIPDVSVAEQVHPKTIDLLMGHREVCLVPQPIKKEGERVLWDGPLEKVIGGTQPIHFESVDVTLYQSETHFAQTMRTSSWKSSFEPHGKNEEIFEWF